MKSMIQARVQRNNSLLKNEIAEYLRKLVVGMLEIPGDYITLETPFIEVGVSSIEVAAIVNKLTENLGQEIHPSIFFEYVNIDELASHFLNEYNQEFKTMFDSYKEEDAML